MLYKFNHPWKKGMPQISDKPFTEEEFMTTDEEVRAIAADNQKSDDPFPSDENQEPGREVSRQVINPNDVKSLLVRCQKMAPDDQQEIFTGVKQLMECHQKASRLTDKTMSEAILKVLAGLWALFGPARKLAKVFDEINARAIEREDELRCALIAVIARQHVLFVGAPGTGKSMLIKMIAKAVQGSQFTVHGTKFLEPDFVFGPIDVVKLGQAIEGKPISGNAFDRLTDGMALDSDFVTFEEVYRASPAVLDTFLLAMEPEREYREGNVKRKAKMISMFGASNSYAPEGCQEAVAAFSDRFAIRKTVRPIVTEQGRSRLRYATEEELTPVFDEPMTIQELEMLHEVSKLVPFSESAKVTLDEIYRELTKEGIIASDRRQRWAIGIAKAAAVLEGSPFVTGEHLEILKHVLWDDPVEQPEKTAKVVARLANPLGAEIAGKLAEFEEQLSKINTNDVTAEGVTAMNKLKNIRESIKKLPHSNKRDQAIEYMTKEEKRLRSLMWSFSN